MPQNERRKKCRPTIDDDIVEDLQDRGMILIDTIGRTHGFNDALRMMGWGKRR